MNPKTFTERLVLVGRALLDAIKSQSQPCLDLAEAELIRIGAEADAQAAQAKTPPTEVR